MPIIESYLRRDECYQQDLNSWQFFVLTLKEIAQLGLPGILDMMPKASNSQHSLGVLKKMWNKVSISGLSATDRD